MLWGQAASATLERARATPRYLLTQILILPIVAFLADLLVVSPFLEVPYPVVLSMQAGLVTLHARLVADMVITGVVMILLSWAPSMLSRIFRGANGKHRA